MIFIVAFLFDPSWTICSGGMRIFCKGAPDAYIALIRPI